MRIAINTRFLLPDFLEGYGYFISESLKYITNTHPEHEFIFIFDRPYDQRFIFSSNIIPVIANPPARHPLLWKYWYDIKIPAVLRKYKAEIFVSPDGFCSLTTRVPQCIVVHDLAFLHYPSHSKRAHQVFLRRYIPKFIKKAKTIVTVSEFSKQDIVRHYKTDPEKINVVYNAAKEIFKPVTASAAEVTKKKYTEGKEYFLYVGAIHPRKNLKNLLKAFSIFKKRQQSNLMLVIAGRLAWKYDSFVQDLKKYKYRHDVVLLGYVEENELARIMASAYSLVYVSLFEGFGIPVLEAMKCGVPVITSIHSSMEEVAKDAALYADPRSFEDIAEKMMLIYKDEKLREELIEKGRSAALGYTWAKTGELLWQSIQKTVS
jgi:glycosyltransferase involved in cell wall biosynthesis